MAQHYLIHGKILSLETNTIFLRPLLKTKKHAKFLVYISNLLEREV